MKNTRRELLKSVSIGSATSLAVGSVSAKGDEGKKPVPGSLPYDLNLVNSLSTKTTVKITIQNLDEDGGGPPEFVTDVQLGPRSRNKNSERITTGMSPGKYSVTITDGKAEESFTWHIPQGGVTWWQGVSVSIRPDMILIYKEEI